MSEVPVAQQVETNEPWRGVAVVGLIVFALAFAYQTIRINRTFIGDNEGTACGLVMMPPLNYLRYGPMAQRLGGIINPGLVSRENFATYVHHPPGVTIASAIAHAIFGRADWVARLAPAIFTSLVAALLAAAFARANQLRLGLLAAGLFLFTPIVARYGGMPDYVNYQVTFFTIACVWCWLQSIRSHERPWQAATVAVFLAAAISDWPGLYAAPVIFVAAIFVRRRFDWFAHLAVPLLAAATLIGLGLWMSWAGSDVGLYERVMLRSNGDLDRGMGAITVSRWLHQVPAMMAMLHTPIVLACLPVFIGASLALWRRWLPRRDEAFIWTWLLIGVFLVHFLVARQGTFQHEWWHAPFSPAIAAAAAWVSIWLITAAERVAPRVATTAAVLLLFAGMAMWSARLDRLERDKYVDAGGYLFKDLGETMRRVAKPDEAVATSDASDWTYQWSQSALGWYADRQLRACVIDVPSFKAAMVPGPYWVFLGYQQPHGPAPSWFVMPVVHRESRRELADYLDANFPRSREGQFDVYDLRSAH